MRQYRYLNRAFVFFAFGFYAGALFGTDPGVIHEITAKIFKPAQVDEDCKQQKHLNTSVLYPSFYQEENRGKAIIDDAVRKYGAQSLIQEDYIGRMPLAACIAAGNPEACNNALLHLHKEYGFIPNYIKTNWRTVYTPLGFAMKLVSSPYHVKTDSTMRYCKRLTMLSNLRAHGYNAEASEYKEAVQTLNSIYVPESYGDVISLREKRIADAYSVLTSVALQ